MMKKTLFTLATVFAFAFMAMPKAEAQKNVIKINPASIFSLTANLAYERVLAPSMSVQLGGSFGVNKFFGLDRTVYSITPEFRWYITGGSQDAPGGFFAAPFLTYRFCSISAEIDNGVIPKFTFTELGGGVDLGYQFLIADVVTLELHAGPCFTTKTSRLTNDQGNVIPQASIDALTGALGPVGLRWAFTAGFAF